MSKLKIFKKPIKKLNKIEPFYICRGTDTHLNVYKDEYEFWLVPLKNKYRNVKEYDSFVFSDEDIIRLKEWLNRPEEEIQDDDHIQISCGCLGKCSLIEFIINKDTPMTVFGEYYIHANYRGNFSRKMASEVDLLFSDLKTMVEAVDIERQKRQNEKNKN